jgi:hypothetical protein
MISDTGTIEIGGDFCGHALADIAQLAFLEIGIDIDLRGWHDAHHWLALRHSLTKLDLASGNGSGDGCADRGAIKIELRSLELG